MASPHSRDRDVLARHNPPQSPLGRAREVSYEFDLDDSNFPTPSKRNATRIKPAFRTGTLAGAYRATSRASMSDDGAGLGLMSSPRRHHEYKTARSPPSDHFNFPDESLDIYKRTDYNRSATDYAPLDDWETHLDTHPIDRLGRMSPRVRGHDVDGPAFSEASFGNENSPRRRTSDFARDEQRLRRVTGQDMPVFSKAKVGARNALTADNLQRREDEEQLETFENESEGGPSLNLPRTWGSRAGHRSEWLRNVSASTTSDPQWIKEAEGRPEPISRTSFNIEDDVAPPQLISQNASKPSFPSRSTLGKRTASLLSQDEIQEGEKSQVDNYQDASQDAGVHVPNTPIVVYKNSSFGGSNAGARGGRDSQSLLRKLARTESPKVEQIQTPEPPKLFERRIYDKTPRVTGAWIDTPVAEKVAEIPHELTKDIVRPSDLSAPTQTTQSPSLEQRETEQYSTQQHSSLESQLKKEDLKPITEAPKQPVSTRLESNTTSQKSRGDKALVSRPNLPKSGLQTVIEEMNSGKEGLDLGDDTMESLQAIMEDQSELKSEEAEEVAYEQEVLKRLEVANKNGQGSVDIERLNDKLHSLAKNINEVKKGLNSLEEHVTRDAAMVPRSNSSQKAESLPPSLHLTEVPDRYAHEDGRIYASLPIPRLWKSFHNPERRRLTKLGWAIISILSWYIIELMMWDRYSHPLIAETCEGYCLRPDAPDFPFVTVTMLWRWSHLQSLLTPTITISLAFCKLLAQLMGLWDGYVEEPPQLSNIVGEIRVNGTPVSFPWLTSPGQTVAPHPTSTTVESVWTPRNEAPVSQTPAPWLDDQVSMDEDEYL
ncbi:hypothetical protein N7539_001892 [Penicillium diatomitis]|uniref:Uncharacterized protein n=1 Tax=Penicillium diatomitis TaxID=2819901 RepID=A0A9W9XHK6_9EURO|nr:uncharacterized protein N7539_001892 [Penicillium diatomitis]KAJ5493146.1 hypothetical protein N7539_001892 [Penicillium diatomitis]